MVITDMVSLPMFLGLTQYGLLIADDCMSDCWLLS
jgi:hypothetical protein